MLGLVVAVLFSCSGAPEDPGDVIDRMIAAYGGPEKIDLLESFAGRGFLKDQFSQAVIRYWPYDHFQRDTMIKTKVALIDKGIEYDIRFTLYDGLNYRVVNKNGDLLDRPPMEIFLIEFRFPLVLDWLRETDLEGELIDNGQESGVCRIEYPGPGYAIEIGVNRDDWLLNYVRFENSNDSTRVFMETYTDYLNVDGVPFPSRFTGTMKDVIPYYEYYFVKIELDADLPDSTFVLSRDELDLIPEEDSVPVAQ